MAYIDLTTVAAVAAWLNQINPDRTIGDAAVLQQAITGYSAYILTRTGRSFLGGVKTYAERYDGNGSQRLFLRNYPVLSVASLSIGGRPIQASPDYVQPGYAIDTSGSRAALVLISGGQRDGGLDQSPWREGGSGWPGRVPGLRFEEGMQNVAVSYTAGYLAEARAEAQTVPAQFPFTVSVANAAAWYADLGATDAEGRSLAGQYTAANGVYTFAAGLSGTSVLLNYSYGAVPEDLFQAVTEIVATNYRRRAWIDQTSQMQPGVGTTSYRSWEMSPQNEAVISRYEPRFYA